MTLLADATQEELEAQLAIVIAAESLVAREATRDAVKAYVDSDLAKVKESGITITADAKDESWVTIQFPEDGDDEKGFWKSQADGFVNAYVAKGKLLRLPNGDIKNTADPSNIVVDARTVRVRADKVKKHLVDVEALL